MGTKYSTNVTSGYNATPPADDGTVSEANKVKWSTIKTKLADPVKDRGDTINTELVEHFDQGPDTHSSAHTTVAGDYNTVLEVTGTTTISLGDASTMTAGYFVTVINAGSNTVTVDLTTGTDTLDGTVGGSQTFEANQGATFIVNNAADGYCTISSARETVSAARMVGASVYHSVNQSITASTDQKLAFDSENFDTDSIHDTVTNNSRLTVPSGLNIAYARITASTKALLKSNDSVLYRLQVYKNNTTVIGGEGRLSITDTTDGTTRADVIMQVNVLDSCTAGDYYELRYRANEAGNSVVGGSDQLEFAVQFFI